MPALGGGQRRWMRGVRSVPARAAAQSSKCRAPDSSGCGISLPNLRHVTYDRDRTESYLKTPNEQIRQGETGTPERGQQEP